MKFYFASSRLALKDQGAWVSGIADAGFDGWEVSMDGWFHGTADLPVTFPKIGKILSDTGLAGTVHAPFSGLNPASLNDDIRNASVSQILACIEQAAGITDRITVHPGYLEPNGRTDLNMAWTRQKKAMEIFGEAAETLGIAVCLENMPNLEDFYCRDPRELEGLVNGTGMKMTFDAGHANTCGNLPGFCSLILPQAYHLHIHDNFGKYDEHLPVGKGSVDWDTVMPQIVKKYTGDIIVVEGRNPAEGKTSLDFLRGWF
jgi:sugar phosphate isomerase/epimerase